MKGVRQRDISSAIFSFCIILLAISLFFYDYNEYRFKAMILSSIIFADDPALITYTRSLRHCSLLNALTSL